MIGFFDSGSGGLSVLSHFRQIAPKAGVIYFGDIKHAPYGEKSPEELKVLTEAGVGALKARGATAIVSACNSVSPSILAGASGDLPSIEMTKPAAAFMRQFLGKRFLLLATPATVASKIYENALRDVVSIDSLAIPGLAGAIEFSESDEKIVSILEDALAAKNTETYDGVILGCTHYPLARALIEPMIRSRFGDILIIDPGEPVAREAARSFGSDEGGAMQFFISQESEPFRMRLGTLFPNEHYSVKVI